MRRRLVPILLAAGSMAAGRPGPGVRVITLDSAFEGGYQVTAADIDGDGRPDVVGLGETVAWLSNPDWRKRPVTGSQTRGNIDVAAYDIDGDGKLDLAVASGFDLNDSGHGGTIQWFSRGASLDVPWTPHPIGAYPTTHRIRWVDVDGTGRKALVCFPILGRGAHAPDYLQAPAPILLYRIPAQPASGPWPCQMIDESLHVVHGVAICDFDGRGRDDILTASAEGVTLFQAHGSGSQLTWTKRRLCEGEQATSPARGSSEVAIGHLNGGVRFIATIEPWHGNEVVISLPPDAAGGLWRRHVIDRSLDEGHALAVFNPGGPGGDVIVAGCRGARHGLTLYRPLDHAGAAWERTVVDDGIAAQCAVVADLNGSGQPDVVAIGGSTHNIREYEIGRLAHAP